MTLLELLVVLAVMGITAGVVGLTLHTASPVQVVDPVRATVQTARDSAIRSGRRVTTVVSEFGVRRPVTAYPDGRVVADRAAHINELNGAPNAAH